MRINEMVDGNRYWLQAINDLQADQFISQLDNCIRIELVNNEKITYKIPPASGIFCKLSDYDQYQTMARFHSSLINLYWMSDPELSSNPDRRGPDPGHLPGHVRDFVTALRLRTNDMTESEQICFSSLKKDLISIILGISHTEVTDDQIDEQTTIYFPRTTDNESDGMVRIQQLTDFYNNNQVGLFSGSRLGKGFENYYKYVNGDARCFLPIKNYIYVNLIDESKQWFIDNCYLLEMDEARLEGLR